MSPPVQRETKHSQAPHQSTWEKAVEAQARSSLIRSGHRPLRNVECCIRHGVLTLRGQVPTYYHKQVAQCLVYRHLESSVPIDNQLRVVGSARAAATT
jgi:hypothetical protein